MSNTFSWKTVTNNTQGLHLDDSDHNRQVSIRIRVRIPRRYRQQSIISRLASDHHVEVNIIAAFLGTNSQDDGWFDLEIGGSSREIDSALIYLSDLDVEIWTKSRTTPDGW